MILARPRYIGWGYGCKTQAQSLQKTWGMSGNFDAGVECIVWRRWGEAYYQPRFPADNNDSQLQTRHVGCDHLNALWDWIASCCWTKPPCDTIGRETIAQVGQLATETRKKIISSLCINLRTRIKKQKGIKKEKKNRNDVHPVHHQSVSHSICMGNYIKYWWAGWVFYF